MRKTLLIIWLVCWTLGASAEEQVPQQFWLGILQDDGILLPLGLYNHGRWLAPWPEPEDLGNRPPLISLPLQELPLNWLGGMQNLPKEWYVWMEKREASPIHVLHAVQYEAACTIGWGLRTDFPPASSNDHWPKLKVGIATSRELLISSMQKLEEVSQEVLSMLMRMQPTFDQLEQEQIERYRKRGKSSGTQLLTGHPLSQQERATVPLTVEKGYKVALPKEGGSLYYIGAFRKYPHPGCYGLTYFHGWIRRHEDDFSIIRAEAVISDCDEIGNDKLTPYLVIHLNGQDYVVAKHRGYEWENYTVTHITDNGYQVVLEVSGGGC